MDPQFAQGAAGGAVLGGFVYATLAAMNGWSPLVDADSADRIEFSEPRRAVVVAPPFDEDQMPVSALETNDGGDYPFKVWVDDGSGKEEHLYYATSVKIRDPRADFDPVENPSVSRERE